MDSQALPDRTASPKDPQPAVGRSCVLCAIPMISAGTQASKPLCSHCRSHVLVDVSRRSTEIRGCIGVLRNSPSASETEYETARQHLLVLAEYERQGILSANPSAAVMLQRLEALRGASQAKMDARRVDRGIRDDRPLVDWVGESVRLDRRCISRHHGLPQGERRAQARLRTSLTVLVHPLGVTALATDASPGGLYLRCPAHRSVGSPVRLMLHTPSGLIIAQGVVRRVDKPKHGTATETIGLAIQFTKIPRGFSLDLLR